MLAQARHQWLTPVILQKSGGRDQEDQGSKPVQANSLKGSGSGGVAQHVDPELKP
jgi:hypothetical protein